jgi:hypothetical protein
MEMEGFFGTGIYSLAPRPTPETLHTEIEGLYLCGPYMPNGWRRQQRFGILLF